MGLAGEDGFLADDHDDGFGAGGRSTGTGDAGHVLVTAEGQAGFIDDIEGLLQSSQRSHAVRRFPVEGPGAELLVSGIGQRAGHQDAAAFAQGQDAVILEQDRRLDGRLFRRSQSLFRIGLDGIFIYIRMLEKTELEFQAQDVADHIVDLAFLDLALGDQFLNKTDEAIGHHVHIDTGVDGDFRSVFQVGGIAVGDHFAGGIPVGHDHSVKTPFIPQDVFEKPAVAGRRDAVILVEGGHQGHGSGIDGGFEGREINIPQGAFRQAGGIVVPAAFGRTVAHEMLHASCQAFALVATDHGRTHQRVQVWIFTGAFRHPAPPGIAGDVQHRGESPADAGGNGLAGSDPGAFLNEGGIEGCRLADRDREHRPETVDDIPADQDRDTEAGLLDSGPLDGVDFGRVHTIEDGSDLALGG